MSARTPGPWHKSNRMSAQHPLYILDAERFLLAEIRGVHGDSEKDEANAEFAVRAVNCHDELLAALSDLLGNYDSDDDGNGHCAHCGRDLEIGHKLCDSDDCAGVLARAAIAKAEE